MKDMRKMSALVMASLLALALAFMVSSCGKKAETPSESSTSESSMPSDSTMHSDSAMADTSMHH